MTIDELRARLNAVFQHLGVSRAGTLTDGSRWSASDLANDAAEKLLPLLTMPPSIPLDEVRRAYDAWDPNAADVPPDAVVSADG